eukprot:2603530-Prorocentrum_lima.AAC.1
MRGVWAWRTAGGDSAGKRPPERRRRIARAAVKWGATRSSSHSWPLVGIQRRVADRSVSQTFTGWSHRSAQLAM